MYESFACLYVCLKRPEEGVGSSGTGVNMLVLRTEPKSSAERQVLLTAEMALQPHRSTIFIPARDYFFSTKSFEVRRPIFDPDLLRRDDPTLVLATPSWWQLI